MESGERDVTYFENNGTELQIEQGDKTAASLVKIAENGTYTVYAEDDSGNKVVETITITEIENQQPEPEPDTTPPTITGVEDGRTYRNYVTPRISDENLVEDRAEFYLQEMTDKITRIAKELTNDNSGLWCYKNSTYAHLLVGNHCHGYQYLMCSA